MTFSLILPVHNQADSIARVVDEIVRIIKNDHITYEIILVENGSRDTTWKVVQKLQVKYKTVRAIQSPLGYGSAVLAGLACARGKYVSYMPSDGQSDATMLPLLLAEIKTNKWDLVKIKRKNRENILRFLNSKAYNLIAHILFSTRLSDINGSPRILKREKLPQLALSYTDSFIDVEMAVKARALNWKIREIPAQDLSRISGKSTVSIRTVIEFLRNFYEFKSQNKLNQWRLDRARINKKNSRIT